MEGFVRLEKKNRHLVILSIERPRAYNALSRQVVDELDAALEEVSSMSEVRVLVIKSSKNFASGADIREMADCGPKEAEKFSFSSTFDKLARLPLPTIAAIEGYALGGGLELALACDMRIASADAKLGFPEITLGIMPGAGGTVRLPRIVGEAKAKELIFLGEPITAGTAMDIGLVNQVVSPERFDEVVEAWAECLSTRSKTALAAAKKTIDECRWEEDEERAVAVERRNWAALFQGSDQKEGMRAFLEKRPPRFND